MKTKLEEKSNKQLIEILYYEKSSANYESIQEIKRILKERGLDKKAILKLKKQVRNRRRISYLEDRKEQTDYGFIGAILEVFIAIFEIFD